MSMVLPLPARVSVGIYTVQGALVRTLFNGPAASGSHRVFWDGRDQRGRAVAPGLYYARMSAGGVQASRTIIVVH